MLLIKYYQNSFEMWNSPSRSSAVTKIIQHQNGSIIQP